MLPTLEQILLNKNEYKILDIIKETAATQETILNNTNFLTISNIEDKNLFKIKEEIKNLFLNFFNNNIFSNEDNNFNEISLFEFTEILSDIITKFEKIGDMIEINFNKFIIQFFKISKDFLIEENNIDFNKNDIPLYILEKKSAELQDFTSIWNIYDLKKIKLIFFKIFEILLWNYNLNYIIHKDLKGNNKWENFEKIFDYYEFILPTGKFYKIKIILFYIIQDLIEENNKFSQRIFQEIFCVFEEFTKNIFSQNIGDTTIDRDIIFLEWIFVMLDKFYFIKILYKKYFSFFPSFFLKKENLLNNIFVNFVIVKFSIKISENDQENTYTDNKKTFPNFTGNDENIQIIPINIYQGNNNKFNSLQDNILRLLNLPNEAEIEKNLEILKFYLRKSLKENQITEENKIYKILIIFNENQILLKLIFDFIFLTFKKIVKEKILKYSKKNISDENFNSKYSNFYQFKILIIFEKFKKIFLCEKNRNFFKLDKLYKENINEQYKKCFVETIENRSLFLSEGINLIIDKIYFISKKIKFSGNYKNFSLENIFKNFFFSKNINLNEKIENIFEEINIQKNLLEKNEKLFFLENGLEKISKFFFFYLNRFFLYLDLIEDFPKFEELYIKLILGRSLEYPETFDIDLEKLIINKIFDITKNKFSHFFKLQTTINSLKITSSTLNGFSFNLLGLPSHCLNLINFGCDPKFSVEFEKIFDKEIINQNFPKNSKFRYQLGNVIFTISRKIKKENKIVDEIYYINTNIILYEILKYFSMKKNEISLVDLEKEYNISEEFANYSLEILLKFDFICEILKKENLENNSIRKIYKFNRDFICTGNNMNLSDIDLDKNFEKKEKIIIENLLCEEIKKFYCEKRNDTKNSGYKKSCELIFDNFNNLIFIDKGENYLENIHKENKKNNYFFLNIRLNFADFLSSKKDTFQMKEKHLNNILDCYIMKTIKKYKNISIEKIFELIKILNIQLLKDLNLKTLTNRLEHLCENFFIKLINHENYEYC